MIKVIRTSIKSPEEILMSKKMKISEEMQVRIILANVYP